MRPLVLKLDAGGPKTRSRPATVGRSDPLGCTPGRGGDYCGLVSKPRKVGRHGCTPLCEAASKKLIRSWVIAVVALTNAVGLTCGFPGAAGAAPVAGTAATTVAHAAAGPRVVQQLAANLDSDPAPEHIRVLDELRPNPFGGTQPLHVQLAEIDDQQGGRPFSQTITPEADYLRVRLTATAVGHSVWYSGSLGNGGAAPRFFGLVSWTGGGARYLWRYSSPSPNLGSRHDGADAELFNDPTSGGPGPEIKLAEGIHRNGDPLCCPASFQTSKYRFDKSRGT